MARREPQKTNRPQPRPCDNCGARNAPFLFRPPGRMADLPERYRHRYATACEKLACRIAAANRIRAAGFDCPHMPREDTA